MFSMNQEKDEYPEFVEVDPTGRYGRYSEILGKGSSKIVYRAFDEYEGIEVAWNQVKLYDFLQSPEDLERLYCEIHLLKTLKHKNIMKFYTSWVDTSKRNINFVTELFTSGTLRQYRQRHKRVSIRALKHWCRQILKGLLYLHSHDPPVIHRDLKCDNIFINGNQGEVKIGDLGLAAILRKSHAAHCVGTPEFMAPEVYEEEYNELVDIYSFGMCVLEMVTLEYPYSECTHPAQIYKKVVSGTKPESLSKIKDPEVRKFVEKCLVTASKRLPARELLKDPFLQLDDHTPVRNEVEVYDIGSIFRQPSLNQLSTNGVSNGYMNDYDNQREVVSGWDYDVADISTHGMDLFNNHEDEHKQNVDITIKGRRKEDGGIFLRLRIADKDGRVRNIYFPFDIETDTALSVATEMVAELDITDYEVTRISEMIDEEVSSLVPEWEPGPGIPETPRHHAYTGLCNHCVSHVSSSSLLDYLSKSQSLSHSQQSSSSHCFNCMAVHGRFEQNITYQEEQNVMDGAPGLSTSQSDEDFENDDKLKQINNARRTRMGKSMGDLNISFDVPEYYWMNLSDESENEIRQELRWLKAKHQKEQREYKESSRVLHPSPDHQSSSMNDTYFQIMENLEGLDVFAGNVFYNDGLVPNGLARTKSLPVDAAEV